MDTFRQFYIDNKDKVFGYLMRLTGDYSLSSDILQESFTRMLSVYGTKELNTSLVFKIARNQLMDTWRKAKRCAETNDPGELKDESDLEKDIMVRESYRAVMQAMKQLSEVERDVLSLAVSSDISYKEIAAIVGISEANVRVKIHRARMRLKEILNEPKGES